MFLCQCYRVQSRMFERILPCVILKASSLDSWIFWSLRYNRWQKNKSLKQIFQVALDLIPCINWMWKFPKFCLKQLQEKMYWENTYSELQTHYFSNIEPIRIYVQQCPQNCTLYPEKPYKRDSPIPIPIHTQETGPGDRTLYADIPCTWTTLSAGCTV